jgi:hypothetical protein
MTVQQLNLFDLPPEPTGLFVKALNGDIEPTVIGRRDMVRGREYFIVTWQETRSSGERSNCNLYFLVEIVLKGGVYDPYPACRPGYKPYKPAGRHWSDDDDDEDDVR